MKEKLSQHEIADFIGGRRQIASFSQCQQCSRGYPSLFGSLGEHRGHGVNKHPPIIIFLRNSRRIKINYTVCKGFPGSHPARLFVLTINED